MILKNKNIYLRTLEPEDLDFLYKTENDPNVWHLSNTQTPFSRFSLNQYIERSLSEDIYALKELRLMICKANDSSSIGLIDLFDFDPKNKRAGIGILISNPDNRDLGYGSQAIETLIDYAFKVLNLHQLYCNIIADNKISIRLFSKYNFELVGIKKDWILHNETWKDEMFFQLIRK